LLEGRKVETWAKVALDNAGQPVNLSQRAVAEIGVGKGICIRTLTNHAAGQRAKAGVRVRQCEWHVESRCVVQPAQHVLRVSLDRLAGNHAFAGRKGWGGVIPKRTGGAAKGGCDNLTADGIAQQRRATT